MNVALFGGTFDPVHRGHLALARAAQKRFRLSQIHFIPANIPPHKQRQPTTPFAHRYAMMVLATLGEKGLIPSLLEAPREFTSTTDSPARPNYTLDTLRNFKRSLKKNDRLFFLIGIDAFLDVAKWHEAEAVLLECEFVVASRPTFSLADVKSALPASLRSSATILTSSHRKPVRKPGSPVIHLLDGVYQPISSTEIRNAAAHKRSLAPWVPKPVAQYIKKLHLYATNARHNAIMEVPPSE